MLMRIAFVLLLALVFTAPKAIAGGPQTSWNGDYIVLASNDDHDEDDRRGYRRPAPVPKPKNIKIIQQQAAEFDARLKSSNSSSAAGGSVSINNREAAAGAASTYLTATDGTCMGSSGISGQGMSFGFGLGTTWRDPKCDMRRDVNMLYGLGQPLAAFMRLCMDDDMATAMKFAGRPCPPSLRAEMQRMATILGVSEPTE